MARTRPRMICKDQKDLGLAMERHTFDDPFLHLQCLSGGKLFGYRFSPAHEHNGSHFLGARSISRFGSIWYTVFTMDLVYIPTHNVDEDLLFPRRTFHGDLTDSNYL